MASKKSFISRANYIFAATSSESDLNEESETLEFDGGEVWNLTNTVSITEPKKGSRSVVKRGSSSRVSPVSLPINIPDWSKILKEENKKRNEINKEDYNYESDHDEGVRTPPHEYLARRRGASLSVHEGIGRTLKGRDLRSVRNAIWKKVGFED